MEQKNEPMSAVDIQKHQMTQAFKSILRHAKDDWTEDEVISDLIAYFTECERRKEKEVLEWLRSEVSEHRDEADNNWDSPTLAAASHILEQINSRLALIEAEK